MKIAGRNLNHHGTSAAFVKNKLLWKVEEMMKTKQTDELLAKDEQYVWHGMRPFSPNSTMVGAKAEGCWVEDIQGKRYLDGMSGLWCVNSGYGRKSSQRQHISNYKHYHTFRCHNRMNPL